MILSMNGFTTQDASPEYLWEPAVISVDGVTIKHVFSLDTVKGWVVAYDLDTDRLKTITGVVEYVRLDASDQ